MNFSNWCSDVSSGITLRWIWLDFTDDKTTMFRVMAWYKPSPGPDLFGHMAQLDHNDLLYELIPSICINACVPLIHYLLQSNHNHTQCNNR